MKNIFFCFVALCVAYLSVAQPVCTQADVAAIKSAAERKANAEAKIAEAKAKKAAANAANKAAAATAAAATAAGKGKETKEPEDKEVGEDSGEKSSSKKKKIRGSRVTLKGEMSLSDALAELHEQTENRLVDYRGRLDQTRTDPTLELNLEDVTYWDAVEAILDQAELTLYSYTNIPNTLGLAERPEGLIENPPVSTSDLFRVQVIRLSSHRDLRDGNAESLVASLEVTWEPRVAPLVVHQAPDEVEANGDDGEPLELIGDHGVGDARVQEGIGAVELELPFKLPPRSVQTIATLAGTLKAQIPTEFKKFTFKNLEGAKDVIEKEDALSVVLENVHKNRELYEFRVLLQLDRAADELKMQQGWIYANPAYLITPGGERVDYAGLEAYRSTQEEIGLSYKFEAKDGLKGYQFIYESPSSISTIPVKYELKGIELP